MSNLVPVDEAERLLQLKSLRMAQDPPQEELQFLCDQAARGLRAPVALVSLVEETEQVFAARVGLGGIAGTPRELSFCTHAIADRGILTVEDAACDPRFADSPLVTGAAGMRAYAGAPLDVAPGAAVGTFCILDTMPRRFAPDELAQLGAFARFASRILVAHRERLGLRDALGLVQRQRAELETRARALEHAAAHCGMTGLLNAASFRARAAAMARMPQGACAFALIDIDNFKQINDSLGHRFGDRYLQAVARALRACLPSGGLAGRMGGDEFGLVLRGPDAADRMAAALHRLGEEHEAGAARLDPQLRATLSIGAAAAAGGGGGFDALYQNADHALYAAKGRGRNCIVWYGPDMDAPGALLATGAGAAVARGA